MLTQLRLAGILENVSAIVLGEFVSCDEPDGGPTGRATLQRLLRDFAGPVIFGVPSGHTTGPSMTLPFGVKATVVAGQKPRLVIAEAALS